MMAFPTTSEDPPDHTSETSNKPSKLKPPLIDITKDDAPLVLDISDKPPLIDISDDSIVLDISNESLVLKLSDSNDSLEVPRELAEMPTHKIITSAQDNAKDINMSHVTVNVTELSNVPVISLPEGFSSLPQEGMLIAADELVNISPESLNVTPERLLLMPGGVIIEDGILIEEDVSLGINMSEVSEKEFEMISVPVTTMSQLLTDIPQEVTSEDESVSPPYMIETINILPPEHATIACPFCDKRYTWKMTLKFHLQKMHAHTRYWKTVDFADIKDPEQACQLCGKMMRANNMASHLKHAHNIIKPRERSSKNHVHLNDVQWQNNFEDTPVSKRGKASKGNKPRRYLPVVNVVPTKLILQEKAVSATATEDEESQQITCNDTRRPVDEGSPTSKRVKVSHESKLGSLAPDKTVANLSFQENEEALSDSGIMMSEISISEEEEGKESIDQNNAEIQLGESMGVKVFSESKPEKHDPEGNVPKPSLQENGEKETLSDTKIIMAASTMRAEGLQIAEVTERIGQNDIQTQLLENFDLDANASNESKPENYVSDAKVPELLLPNSASRETFPDNSIFNTSGHHMMLEEEEENVLGEFKSYKDAIAYFEDYKKETCTTLKELSSKSISNGMIQRVEFICIHGMKTKKKGKGIQKRSQNDRKCPFKVSIYLSKKLWAYVMKTQHQHANHDFHEEAFQDRPQKRRFRNQNPERLSDEQLEQVTQFAIEFKGRKKRAKNDVGVTSKINNAQNGQQLLDVSVRQTPTRGDMGKTINLLQKKRAEDSNASFHLLYSSDTENAKTVRCIFWQSGAQKELFKKFGTVLFADATDSLRNRHYVRVTYLVVDNHNCSQVIAWAVISKEENNILSETLALLESTNPEAISRMRYVILDKDFSEIVTLRSVVPHAHVVICSWHVKKAMEKWFKSNLQFRDDESEMMAKLSKIYNDLITAPTKNIYMATYDELQTLAQVNEQMEKASRYIEEHWHLHKEHFAYYILRDHELLGNFTYNRLQISKDLKALVGHKKLSIHEHAQIMLDSEVRNQQNHFHKSHENENKEFSPECADKHEQEIVMFARDYLSEDVVTMLMAEYKASLTLTEDTVKTERGLTSCPKMENKCTFNVQHKLPCKHLFFVKRLNEECMMTTGMIGGNWLKKQANGSKTGSCYYAESALLDAL